MPGVIYANVPKDKPITSLDGLQGARKLETLYLNGSAVTDLSPLKGLPSLTQVTIIGGKVTDLSPLASLTDLDILHLDGNQIGALKSVSFLGLKNNQIREVSPLTGLTTLRYL